MKISKGCQYSGKLWLCLNGVVFCILQFYISHIIFHLPKYPILQQKGSWAFQNVLERNLGERWEKWLLSSSDYLVTGWKDTNGSHRRIKDPFPKQGSFQCFLPRAGTRVDVGASAAAVEHKPCRVALAEKGRESWGCSGFWCEPAPAPIPKEVGWPLHHSERRNILSLKPQARNSNHTKPGPYVLTESSHFRDQVGLFQKWVQRFAVDFSLTQVPLVNCLKISSTWLQFISLTNPWGHDSTKQ